MYDIIIRNGIIYDGLSEAQIGKDIGIKDGIITEITDLHGISANVEIDAKYLIVSPGFIDLHSHSDLMCTKPSIHKIKVMQGVTTELIGQDGLSVAPVSEETKGLWQKQLKSLNGDIGEWPWNTVKEFLNFLDGEELSSNMMYLVPHGAIRTLVKGFDESEATNSELSKMSKHVEEAMEEGAIGISSGLIYPPNVFSNLEELIAITRPVAKYNGIFVVHIRNESHGILDALKEVIEVSKVTGVHLHVSHFKVVGKKNSDKYDEALMLMEDAVANGVKVTFDQYPYTAGSSVLPAILPPWVHSGGIEQMLLRLNDTSLREEIIYEMENSYEYDNIVLACGWEGVVVSSVVSEKNKDLEGKNISELAEINGIPPGEAVLDLLIEEQGEVGMINHWGYEKDVIKAMKHPLQVVGSDGIFGGKPHPRLYGTYPRVFGEYVRDKKVLSLSEAIYKTTAFPAEIANLPDRGVIKEGYKADIVIFNKEEIVDMSTYEEPLQKPRGIKYVIVNGELTVENEKFYNLAAGKVLRNNGK